MSAAREILAAAGALAPALAALALRATAVLACAFLADRALRRAPAAARHLVWATAFVALAVLPLLAPALPRVALPVLPEAWMETVEGSAGDERVATGAGAAGPATAPSPVRSAVAVRRGNGTAGAAPPPPRAAAAISTGRGAASLARPVAGASVAVAAGGALLLLSYLLLGVFRAGVLVRRADRLDDDPRWSALLDEAVAVQRPRRRPALARSDRVAVPMLCGVFRSTILLPAAASWTDEERRRVLAHEVAHAARRDPAVQVAARAVAALYWWHPLAWRALSRLVLTAELACDDRVLAGGAAGPDYARQLLALARPDAAARRPAVAVAMARRPHLALRVRALLDDGRARGPLPRGTTAAALAAVVVAAALVAPVRLTAANEAWGERQVDSSSISHAEPAARSASGSPPWQERAWTREKLLRERHRMTPLMQAVLSGDHAAARRLPAGGADPDAGAPSLGTPLILAATAGDAALVDLLLAAGADPNRAETGVERPGDLQRSPLGAAAQSGDLATVEALLAAGARVDVVPSGDATPLGTAARYGFTSVARRLIAAGADVDARVIGDGTPLIEAARGGHLDIVELLLAAGAPPDTAVVGDGNPLIAAAEGGHREVLARLLAAGADPDVWVAGDESALYHAIERGDAWMVERLIAAGADVSGDWPEEEGPLELAAQSGSPRVVDLLRAAGARR